MRPAILIVDDDQNDVLLVKHAFQRAGLRNPIQTVANGLEAKAYLSGEPPYSNRDEYPIPALVLLDIRMPLTDGFEALRWIRQHPRFEHLCVVMLTSVDELRDATRAYQLGANSFLVKPLDFWNAADLLRWVERLLLKCQPPAVNR